MNQSKVLNELLDKFEPSVAAAFRAAMADWRNNLDMSAFIRALASGDVTAAVAALHLDPASLQPFLDSLSAAYNSAGQQTAAAFPTLRSSVTNARFVVRFNG